ncbi:HAD-IIB family hydrolase [Rhizobiaceae bacterium]|nr:HAD-IIB family hydrolase [Rhizobiaceae bacterium]
MFIMHIALQGCLRGTDVPYGLTPDTGGHIKYLLELVHATSAMPQIERQQIIVRRFNDPRLGDEYGEAGEVLDAKSEIVRLAGGLPGYLAKEELHRDLPVLADNLERHIRSLKRRPDILHAHYADAGWLAAQMKERLGIGYIFTAHSLGHVKRQATGVADAHDELDRRIALEEVAIAAADRIVCSSYDEAELQYPHYESFRQETVRINPPGCDLAAFRTPGKRRSWVSESASRFLSEPSKPAILAIARPVRKKNLAGLVRAFAQNQALQERANLVIFAGSRENIADEDREPREVLSELLHLVDLHDLWGKVALPKSHASALVPDIYRHAVETRGVFVNVALNEPFGLTLLEAAATGLPVVATDSGGPNDILTRCRNGALVDPLDERAVGEAILHLLDDDVAWDAASRNGMDESARYCWSRHAKEYVSDVSYLTTKKLRAPGPKRTFDHLLVCDIDNTLTGEPSSLARLRGWLADRPDTAFGIATGRSLNSALELIENWKLPAPDVMITSVGSEIYWPTDRSLRDIRADESWPPASQSNWDADGMRVVLAGFEGVTLQPAREQRRFKLSYFLDDATMVPRIRQALNEASFEFEIIHSHGQYLDLLPRGVCKGHAIEHAAARFGIPMAEVMAAGDSGNDRSMLERVGRPIVVGNHTAELHDLKGRAEPYYARSSFAAGVLEGVEQHLAEAS